MWSSVLPLCVPYAIVLCILLTQHHVQSATSPSVLTSRGSVTGVIETTPVTYYRYSGIPYANITERFKASTPLKTWKYTVVADKEGPICPQLIQDWFPKTILSQSEDCLVLNIYTPVVPDTTTKLPVLVYIHGGGFVSGSGNAAWGGPQFFMLEGGTVIVTINYRLGIFGFLSTGTEDVQGNAGMKDQVEALKWVQQEISNFGGDPNCITIFGESAGGASVVHHVLSPMSKGLFHRAIAESGTAVADWANIEADIAREHAIRIGKNLGCDTENITTMVSCFNKMSTSALLQAANNILTEQENIQDFLVFSPVIETKFNEEVFLADYPENIIHRLNTTVPLIIGTNKDEGASFISDNNYTYAAIDRNLPNFFPLAVRRQNPDQLEAYGKKLRDYYFGGGNVNETVLSGCVNLFTDQLFMYPAAETVRKLVQRHTGDVYLYNFAYSGNDYSSPNKLNPKLGYKAVGHGEELSYLLYWGQNLTDTTTQDYKTMQRMVKLWKAFAKDGKPVSTDEVIKGILWTQITNASELTYLEMNTDFSLKSNYYKERIAVWDQIIHPTSSSLKTEPTTLLTLVSLLLIFKMF